MTKYIIKDTTLASIGNSIRAKTGGTDLILPSAMPDAIAGIVSGGGSGDYIWSIQHSGSEVSEDTTAGTYTLTTADKPSSEIEYANIVSDWMQSNRTNSKFNSIYYSNGTWVAGGYNVGLYYSTDGMTWTHSNVTSTGFKKVYYANGIWVAGSYSNSGLYYSTDGMTWTHSNGTSGRFDSIYYANGNWVAAGGNDNNGLYYSKITQKTLTLTI